MNVQNTIFDLNTMDEVTLIKPVPEFKPVTSTHDALARLGNDSARFLKVINDGLESEERDAVRDNSEIPWAVEDEEGNLVPFEGVPADKKAVNTLRLNLAKSVFGLTKEMSLEEKQKAKSDAMEFIRSTPKIVEGLKKTAISK